MERYDYTIKWKDMTIRLNGKILLYDEMERYDYLSAKDINIGDDLICLCKK